MERKIYVVDDDAAVRDGLKTVFELENFTVSAFDSGGDFLRALDTEDHHILLLDVHLPGQSGIEVLRKLSEINYAAPVFVISGKGDIPTAVSAIKLGALDFIEKPFNGADIVERVCAIADEMQERHQEGGKLSFDGVKSLTPRERDVLQLIASGASNKEAGRNLGISPRTVEVHRARIMEKLKAKNTADLVRIVMGG